MKKCFRFAGLMVLLISVVALAAAEERPMLLRVSLQQKQAIEFLRSHNFDIAYISPEGIAEIVADDADLANLQSNGLNPEIVHKDLVAYYQSRYPLGATMGGFPTLAEALAIMDSLHALYPSITTARDSIGASYNGRALWMMKISDNADTDEEEPEFFINGLIHAREPMGLESCVRFMGYLCQNYGADSLVTNLVNNREFYFVPVINPDGYEYNRQINPNGGGMWRKNRHGQGIDLNRNWGFMWGFDDNGSSPYPGDETYRGDAPFSEPETEAMRQFIIGRHFNIVMNFHSFGNYFLYPWGYYNGFTPDQSLFAVIGDSATAENSYAPGTPWQLLYNTNGDANDWQYGEQQEKPRIFGFVMEIGDNYDGFWPSPSRIDDLWNGVLPTLLYLSRIVDNPYAINFPAAPVLSPIGDVYNDSIVINWNHADTLNPAVAYELQELSGLTRTIDSLESGTANWVLDGFNRRSTRRHSGTYSLFSGSQNNYNGAAVLVNTVTAAAHDTLTFWTWYNIESGYDYAYVQLSTDGGVNYINLEGTITTNSNPNGLNQGNGITGSSNGWVFAKFPLDAYAGQSAKLGLRYCTDGGVLNEGFYVDEFYPVEVFANQNIVDSDIQDTTYTLTGRPEGSYFYQARARDAQGQWSGFSNREEAIVHAPVSVGDLPIPRELTLGQNYPNPFNPQTTIAFTLPRKSDVELVVYDILGSRVVTLARGTMAEGTHRVAFNAEVITVAAGVYFYRLKADGQTLTKKMLYLK